MAHIATLILLLPLLGYVLVLANGRALKERAIGAVATGVVAISFILTVVAFIMLLHRSNREVTVHLFNWISVGSLHVPAALLVDPLSITMCLFVTGISALIHLYSTAYMHGERDYRKFFLYLNLFVFSMLVLVLSNNLLMTFVGWEGVGVCSYWLVSYYFDRDSAASAGKKAFLYNRVGDFGLLIAMFLLFHYTHTLNYLGDLPPRGHAVADGRDLDGARAAARRDRQERADSTLQLAARRHGRPDPGVGTHPRRDHGDGRCLPLGAHVAGAHDVARRATHDRVHRRRSPRSSPRRSRPPRRTSRRCWPSPRSPRSATWCSPSASAPIRPRSS